MRTEAQKSAASDSMHRVKLYLLTDDGKWDDRGTGYAAVDYLKGSEDIGVFVIDEEDNEMLLCHRISSEAIYQRPEDKIISWQDLTVAAKLALSFQETAGCSYIWDIISAAQESLQSSTPDLEDVGASEADGNCVIGYLFIFVSIAGTFQTFDGLDSEKEVKESDKEEK